MPYRTNARPPEAAPRPGPRIRLSLPFLIGGAISSGGVLSLLKQATLPSCAASLVVTLLWAWLIHNARQLREK